MTKLPNEKPLVAVTWNDANSTVASTLVDDSNIDTHHAPSVFTTVGWLLRDDAIGVSICNEYYDDGVYRGHTFIPRALVTGLRIVRQSKKAPVESE